MTTDSNYISPSVNAITNEDVKFIELQISSQYPNDLGESS